jgi:hypothetical protein
LIFLLFFSIFFQVFKNLLLICIFFDFSNFLLVFSIFIWFLGQFFQFRKSTLVFKFSPFFPRFFFQISFFFDGWTLLGLTNPQTDIVGVEALVQVHDDPPLLPVRRFPSTGSLPV